MHIATGYGRLNEYPRLEEGKKREQNLGAGEAFLSDQRESTAVWTHALGRDAVTLTKLLTAPHRQMQRKAADAVQAHAGCGCGLRLRVAEASTGRSPLHFQTPRNPREVN